MFGRKQPYTDKGIKQVKCVRCGKQAMFQWNICSDNNLHRPICRECDIELNEMVLKWMNFPDWEDKMKIYRKRLDNI